MNSLAVLSLLFAVSIEANLWDTIARNQGYEAKNSDEDYSFEAGNIVKTHEAVKEQNMPLDLNNIRTIPLHPIGEHTGPQLPEKGPEKAVLRDIFKGCYKKASRVCYKACKSASSAACSAYECKSKLKSKLKKECKRSCKRSFVGDKDDDYDDDDDDDYDY